MPTVQTPIITETHRLSPYAVVLPAVALSQRALVAASLLVVAPKGKP